MAAVLIHGLNARHFGRMDREFWALALAFIVVLGPLIFAGILVGRPEVVPGILDTEPHLA